MTRLTGKIALVTGAASGIGRACAVALGKEGARVALGDVDVGGLHQTAAMIQANSGICKTYPLDVTQELAWQNVLRAVERDFGGLHILVNNAGICVAAPIGEMSYETWRRQLAINLDSMFFAAKFAVPLMAATGSGSIINMSSVAGLKGIAGLAGYCASKAGVRMFTKSLALECAAAKNNVRANSVHPGAIETPIWVKMAYGGDLPAADVLRNSNAMEDARAASEAATPIGHAGMPEDIAAGVVYLASDDARFVTGTELVIDGGVMAG
jgi:NAD(P)-dependent dehydrogenase (short-subunit alcohol dehydrogenase family)